MHIWEIPSFEAVLSITLVLEGVFRLRIIGRSKFVFMGSKTPGVLRRNLHSSVLVKRLYQWRTAYFKDAYSGILTKKRVGHLVATITSYLL